MFERFTDGARRIVVLAQEEARLLNHNYIGTEHVLLGLMHEGRGVAARALESLDISLEAARVQVEEIIGPGGHAPSGHIPFTPRAKKVLELSLREALQLGHDYIGTEHILLGLIREGEGVGAQVLVKLGANLGRVRGRVIELFSQGPMRDVPLGGARVVAGAGSVTPPPMMGHVRGVCLMCGRDLWEVNRYTRGELGAVCDDCVESSKRALDDAPEGQREVALPPRIFAAEGVFDFDATEEIVHAFETVLGSRGTPEEGATLIEDGARVMPFMAEAAARTPDINVEGVRVSRIRMNDPEHADVRFVVVLGGRGEMTFEGAAVRHEGRWLISRDTIARLVAAAGVQLPPAE